MREQMNLEQWLQNGETWEKALRQGNLIFT